MNTQTDTTINPMQAAEAAALEDHSLPADEVLAEQQSEAAESDYAPIFIP